MTPEQLERLKARRDEIIAVAMGRCWHISTVGYYCDKCGAYILDEDSVHTIPNPDYSTPEGWFELYHWLTKEKPDWWIDFYWLWEEYIKKEYKKHNIYSKDHNIARYFIDNFPDLFVEWLVETEAGWHNKGKLTPLGELMREVLSITLEVGKKYRLNIV